MSEPVIFSVAIPSPLRRTFDYLPPQAPSLPDPKRLKPGVRLLVPFGHQQVVGILLEVKSSSSLPIQQLREVYGSLDTEPVIPDDLLKLCQWAANYYHHPLGEVVHTAMPALLRQGEAAQLQGDDVWELTAEGKGLPEGALKRAPKQSHLHKLLLNEGCLSKQQLEHYSVNRTTLNNLISKGLARQSTRLPAAKKHGQLLRQPSLPLNPEQHTALEQIQLQRYRTYLLEGATGSGKTEVYLQLIERVVNAGNQALVLVPEIGLTPQTISRFEQRFAVNIAVLHSGLSSRERLQAWLSTAAGRAKIAIGTRSAIFTPLPNPGVIIVDEEHDPSFKQQDGFRYSARDLAVMRASQLGIPLLLGSATPALETLHNALGNRYQRLQLTQRAGQAQQPDIQLIDIRGQQLQEGFSKALLNTMEMELNLGHQVLVFINRRGFAPTLLCHDCGWVAVCPHCDARLTVHQQPRHLHCHHCDHQRPLTRQCPECFSTDLNSVGLGTERSEFFLQHYFPKIKIHRIDRDTTRRKNAIGNVIDEINQGQACILVGTQMLAKGHHFPSVTLVAVIDADGGLLSTDFRGPERMGQLLTQVAGRAGRERKRGRVIIQSHHCQHPLMQTLIHQGYHPFARYLLNERQQTHMPPYRYLALLRAESKRAQNATEFLTTARQIAERLQPASVELHYLGPLPAALEKRNNRFRYQLQINAAGRPHLQSLLKALCQQLDNHPLSRRVRWSIDVDPQEMN